MLKRRFLILQSNYMSEYMLNDIENLDNVTIYHRKKVFKNQFLNLLFNIHNSGKIQKYINLPFKSLWDGVIFNKILNSSTPDYIIITISWYSDHLLHYFRRKSGNSIILFRFTDLVTNELQDYSELMLKKFKAQFNGVLVYSHEDAEKYGYTYHFAGYSEINKALLKPCKQYDVVFIGAEKGRMDKIRHAYNLFISAGLSCFFYVILVKEEDRMDDGIIYADKIMPFNEYLSYEVAAKCLFEIVQDGTSGRTYRMMESIIYNKLLITNCNEITCTNYYNTDYVQLYNDVADIDPSFVVKSPDKIDYRYKGDFSPTRVLEFIESKW